VLCGKLLLRGGVLVMRGEPGVGKTALLEDLCERAEGIRVARAGGWPPRPVFLLRRCTGSGVITSSNRTRSAFYDALAGGTDVPNVDPQLAKIARDLVKSIREDLTVDWADRASTEAAIRRQIRRLLREHEYMLPVAPPGGGSVQDINHFAELVLDQAKTLYRYWPDVEGRLFE
jgi:hypothetical protein